MRQLILIFALMILGTLTAAAQPASGKHNAVATQTKVIDHGYIAILHVYIDGFYYDFRVGCNQHQPDCEQLEVGETFVIWMLNDSDPDAYQKVGKIKGSFRIIGKDKALVYFCTGLIKTDRQGNVIPIDPGK
jgi:hypothetical protein